MHEARFDDRVAVITGAGRGLGREYARLLAARGAKVVVNDVGSAMSGDGTDISIADGVVAEIHAMGGAAMADTHSVATPEGGAATIAAALAAYGRVDILIHNAGNVRFGAVAEMPYADFRAVVDVHLLGAFHVAQPAFRAMLGAGYGRIVLTSSIGGLYSIPHGVNYAISKSGMIGLNNVLAHEGAAHNIRSNIILPGAVTRMAEGLDISEYPPMGPELVAPVVGWLAHESCSISGEMLASIGGRVARAYIGETRGVYRADWSIENVGAEIDEIRNPDLAMVFPALPSGFTDHLEYSFAMARGTN